MNEYRLLPLIASSPSSHSSSDSSLKESGGNCATLTGAAEGGLTIGVTVIAGGNSGSIDATTPPPHPSTLGACVCPIPTGSITRPSVNNLSIAGHLFIFFRVQHNETVPLVNRFFAQYR
uniref:(northern house mosquito) hypothetical protein n=1 Tax=Culex pipiens TaxID=7175 RepID=A0A8D8FJ04_CULPI